VPRLRSVGKQAANPLDLAQLRDVNAVAQAAAATYVPLTSGNQPGGYARLDNGATPKLFNAQMPTDPSVTTLTSSGKTKAGSLEITGVASIANNATVGGTLGVASALTAASVDVGTGSLKAATADIPSITSANFAAKATALDSLTVSGATNLAGLNLSGSLVAQDVSTTALSSSGDVVATNQVRGATVRSTGSLIVDGAASLQGVTVAGSLATQAITAAQQIRGNGGFRLGVGATLSQVDANNNNVPIKVAGGVDVNGALTNVTSLNTTSGMNVGGALTASGKGTFSDLESTSNLKIAGTLTGVSDLALTGNLSVTGAGKQITATALSTTTLTASGASNLAAVTTTGLTVNGNETVTGTLSVTGAVAIGSPTNANHAARYGDVFEYINRRYPNANPTIAHNTWVTINMDTWEVNDGGLSTAGTQYTVATGYDGVWYVGASIKFVYKNSAGSKIIEIQKNGDPVTWQDCTSYDGYLHCGAFIRAAAGDVFTLNAFQFTGASLQIERCKFELHRIRK